MSSEHQLAKTRNSRNGLSRQSRTAAARKKTIDCRSLSTHLTDDTINSDMHLNLFVFFVLLVDNSFFQVDEILMYMALLHSRLYRSLTFRFGKYS
jgi:hypothetical protein